MKNKDGETLSQVHSQDSQTIYINSNIRETRSRIMRRSKLEMHIAVLKALACHGRLKLTHVMYKANVNCGALKQCLDLLIQHNLVGEHTLHKKRTVYAITEKGLTALKNAMEINNALQIFEEANIPSITMLSKSQQHL